MATTTDPRRPGALPGALAVVVCLAACLLPLAAAGGLPAGLMSAVRGALLPAALLGLATAGAAGVWRCRRRADPRGRPRSATVAITEPATSSAWTPGSLASHWAAVGFPPATTPTGAVTRVNSPAESGPGQLRDVQERRDQQQPPKHAMPMLYRRHRSASAALAPALAKFVHLAATDHANPATVWRERIGAQLPVCARLGVTSLSGYRLELESPPVVVAPRAGPRVGSAGDIHTAIALEVGAGLAAHPGVGRVDRGRARPEVEVAAAGGDPLRVCLDAVGLLPGGRLEGRERAVLGRPPHVHDLARHAQVDQVEVHRRPTRRIRVHPDVALGARRVDAVVDREVVLDRRPWRGALHVDAGRHVLVHGVGDDPLSGRVEIVDAMIAVAVAQVVDHQVVVGAAVELQAGVLVVMADVAVDGVVVAAHVDTGRGARVTPGVAVGVVAGDLDPAAGAVEEDAGLAVVVGDIPRHQ